MSFKTRRDRMLARLFTRFPSLVNGWAESRDFVVNVNTPWTPFARDLKEYRIALVTTGGVHLRSQPSFDMEDWEGDPTFRVIPHGSSGGDLMITHNYYDHRDADRDVNVVFPLQRLTEFEEEKIIGEVASHHFSFMGHIIGGHLDTLVNQTGPQVAGMLKEDGVDAVFLTPA